MIVLYKMGTWQAATNFIEYNAPATAFTKDTRYHFVSQALSKYPNGIPETLGMQTLSGASVANSTQFSVFYNLSKKKMNVVFGRNYSKPYSFNSDGSAFAMATPAE